MSLKTVGTVESLWRYPVKSMAGERLAEVYMGFAGVYGDRCYAFRDAGARKGFPYLNATAQERMLLCRPQFRHPARALMPPNLAEAAAIAPGVNPVSGDAEDLALDVVTPSGEVLPVDSPSLVSMFEDWLGEERRLTLVRSDRALTDCRPLSFISLQTIRQIEAEAGVTLDKRRFRANVYIDLSGGEGFAEDELVGRRLRIGRRAVVAVLERDPRCKMISLDPETGEHQPGVLRAVAQAHAACAGVYAATLVEGVLSEGDTVELLEPE